MQSAHIGALQLNPLALPPETNGRFNLLFACSLLIAANVGIFFTVLYFPKLNFSGRAEDNAAFPTPKAPQYFEESETAWVERATDALWGLVAPLSLCLGVSVLGLVVYATHPLRIRRRKGLRRLNRDMDPDLHAEVRSLASAASIGSPPTIETTEGLSGRGAQLFGFPFHYVLRVDGGLRVLLRKSPREFRAIVLHELGHMRNKDVTLTYFGQGLWTSVVLIVLVPFLLTIGLLIGRAVQVNPTDRVLGTNLPTTILELVQVGALIAVIGAVRASLLRVREMYADWRVVECGEADALSKILNAEPRGVTRLSWGVTGVWRLHPKPSDRLAAIGDPLRFFRLSPDLPVSAGLLLSLAITGGLEIVLVAAIGLLSTVSAALSRLGGLGLPEMLGPDLEKLVLGVLNIAIPVSELALIGVPFLILAFFVSRTLGAQVEREAIAEVSTNPRSGRWALRPGGAAVLVALGLEAGFYVSPLALLCPWFLGDGNPSYAVLALPWIIAVVVMTWLWLVYVKLLARLVVSRHSGTKSPIAKARAGGLAGAILLGVMYAPLIASRVLIAFDAEANKGVELTLELAMATVLPISWAGITGLILWIVACVVTVVVLFIARLIAGGIECPQCGRRSRSRYAVGNECEYCGGALAPWSVARVHWLPERRKATDSH